MTTYAIDVSCTPTPSGWACVVTISGRSGRRTSHEVSVSHDDLARLAPTETTPEPLVRRSMQFLLERESPDSILRRFDLPVIGRYFPEYERTIRG